MGTTKRKLIHKSIKNKSMDMVTGKAVVTIGETIKVSNAKRRIVAAFKRDLIYTNPAYAEAVKHGRYIPVDLMPSIIFYQKVYNDYIVPAAYREQLLKELSLLGQDVDYVDNTFCGKDPNHKGLNLSFNGDERGYQLEAVQAVVNAGNNGILEALTGSGKTSCAIQIMIKRDVPTLILVHSKELLYQWRDSIEKFTGYKVGLLGDGKKKIKGITVGIINTASKITDSLYGKFGLLVADECHRIMSPIWQKTVNNLNPTYRLGLSATPFRRSKDTTNGIMALTGKIVHRIDPKILRDSGAVLVPKIIRKSTNFMYDFRDDYSDMIKALTTNQERNKLIIQTIQEDIMSYGGQAIILSDRVSHCEALKDIIEQQFVGTKLNDIVVEVLSSKVPREKRKSIVQRVKNGSVGIVISTVSLISEGFDASTLSVMFLTTPIRFRGRAIQSIGRILRPKKIKGHPRLYDFRDMKIPVLSHSAFGRDHIYKTQGWQK